MNQKFEISTLICVSTPKEKVPELVDYYTLKGNIVLLSCFNIVDDNNLGIEDYLDMDKEKIGISDRLIVCGELLPTDTYANLLIEYSNSIGKNIYYTSI